MRDSRALDILTQDEPHLGMCLVVRDLSNLWLVPRRPSHADLLRPVARTTATTRVTS